MNGTIQFNSDEVSTYYAVRVPHLKQRRAPEWRSPCPIHQGEDDNFSVEADTGLWFCHSTCGRGGDILELEAALMGGDFPTQRTEVFRLVGRSEPDYPRNGVVTNGTLARSAPSERTKPPRHPTIPSDWTEEGHYPYVDQAGRLVYWVVRYRKPNGGKTFRLCRPNGRGGFIWNVDGVERVPYRLPEVLKSETVYLPEGELDVSTLESWGLVASCNSEGAGKGDWTKWAEHYWGRHLVILPDNDEPGRKHAAAVAAALLNAAASIRVVELPNLPEKGDVSNWREAGGTFEQFMELTNRAVLIDAAALSALRTRWGLKEDETRHQAEAVDDWPKPEPIQSELPPVEAFSEDLLPESFRPLVADVTERMQVPMDYPAVVMMLCLAGAVNRRATIQPKANDTGWVIVPNLWGGIIAPPGFMKSPVIQAATRPLNQIQAEWRNEHEAALIDYARQKEEYELRRAAWKEQFKAASKKGNTAPDRPEDEPKEPKLPRLIVNDATFEALHQTMSENPAGILVIRDELTGWWSQLDKAGREGERAFCLQAWNGDTGHTIDRIGRGTIHVEACCMSMLGGIQPGRLRSYLVDALKDGPSNDGLIQRFQVLVWPDTMREFADVDRVPDLASEEHVSRVFRALVEMDAENPARFNFGPDAQELFTEWRAELEEKVRGDELHPALISHLSKYRSLMPSLALLFHLAESSGGGSGRVSLRHAQQAAG
ncbi:MAG TPA: DUF3987 domain-containing protein [Bryobacteraceae bacterium]|nr:DUF3987 domain-containing protein [Bryobacteraceae bacterium]